MVSKKILDDLKNTLSIAHASLQAQAHGRKQSAKKRVREGTLPRQQPLPKKLPGKNPTNPMWLAKSVVDAAIGGPLPQPRKVNKPTPLNHGKEALSQKRN
jgi:hypothetical protein